MNFFYILFSHKRTVLSFEAEAIIFPSGFIEIWLIAFLWAKNLYGLEFGRKLNTNIFPSSLPVIACFLYF